MRALAIAFIVVGLSHTASGKVPPIGRTMVNEVADYVVTAGETFATIGARLGIDPVATARRNSRWVHASLDAGTRLRVGVHRTVPGGLERGVIVNLAQRRAFLLDSSGSIVVMPTVTGADAHTPLGPFRVTRQDATWMGLSSADVEVMFEHIEVGAPGLVVDEPALLTKHDGRIFVEVHRDVYKQAPDILRGLEHAADHVGVRHLVDWRRVQDVIRRHEGLAIDVTNALWRHD